MTSLELMFDIDNRRSTLYASADELMSEGLGQCQKKTSFKPIH